MGCLTRIPKGVKICVAISAVILIILVVILIILFFTILKPKKPQISTKSVTLDNVEWVLFPVFHLNVSLGIVVTVNNRNYGSFKHENSTTYITYRGILAAEAPIKADTIPARAKHDVATQVVIIVENLTKSPYYLEDYNVAGCLNFTATTSLHGKAKVLKLFKIKVTTLTTCDISFFVQNQTVSSSCNSKAKY